MQTCLGGEIEEHESNKNALTCLLDTLSVFLWRTLAISALFQWVGSLFSLSVYIYYEHSYAPINGLPQDGGGGRATHGNFDIFRVSNVNFPTLGSP